MLDIKELKAKSTGELLIEHSKLVSDVSVKIAEIVGIKHDLMETIRISGLLHDIGKSCKSFQSMLSDHEYDSNIGNKFRHNEIGWAFLVNTLPNDIGYNKDYILNTVYWHHGISNKLNEYTNSEILSEISDEDKNTMKEVYSSLVKNITGTEYTKKSPLYYPIELDNPDLMLIRICVLSADRLVSKGISLDNIEDTVKRTVNKLTERNSVNKINCYDNERFNLQKEIASNTDKTVIVKAPAGFGKTITGLMWSLNSDKKLLWVCPRNIVAESVYSTIIKELSNLGCKNSVELYLTGEVKQSNSGNINGFESDIIVTNIDSFLSPSFNMKNIDKFYQILNCDIIFDEYHELVTESSLFSLFINIMKIRHRKLDVKTMLLSATPSIIHKIWESNEVKSTILPDKSNHFKAAHDKNYRLNIIDSNEISSLNKQDDSLIMFNSIRNSQKLSKNIGDNVINIHSKFDTDDKDRVMDLLYKHYGKGSTCLIKPCVISAPVIQAAVDVSFKSLHESIFSPESTLQRIGRVNRWGCYDSGEISIYRSHTKDRGEKSCINELYNINLSDLWYNKISEYNGKDINLDEIYRIYNKFNESNESSILSYIERKYNESCKKLEKVYPIKFNSDKSNDIMTAGSNKLRSNGNEIFYIVKKNDGTHTDVFSTEIIDNNYGSIFKEHLNKNITQDIIRNMKQVNDNRYDYSKMIKNKKITIDDIRRNARKSNTPYIAVNFNYDEKLGILFDN